MHRAMAVPQQRRAIVTVGQEPHSIPSQPIGAGPTGGRRPPKGSATAWRVGGFLAALLLVTAVPAQAAVTINKSFAPASMTVDGTSTITITLGNTGVAPATGTAFTDTLPSGLVIASPSNVATTCGGSASATPGGGMVSLAGGTIPASGGSCTVTASVTSDTLGSYTNTIPAGGVTSSEGSNGAPASATLAVISAQPVTGSWGVTFPPGFGGNLKGNGPALTYTLTVNNPNTLALTNVGLTFSLQTPTLAFATPPNLTTTCGGTVTPNTAAGTGTLAGGTIPANGSCTVSLDVIAGEPNVYFFARAALTVPAGAITNDQGVTNSAAIGTLVGVQTGSRVDKSFSPTSIASGATSTLTLTIHNFNFSALSPFDLTDALPSSASGAMTVAPTPNASTTCGGTLTAVAGSNSVQLSGGSLPSVPPTAATSVTCTVTVDVTASNTTSSNIILTNTIPAATLNGVGYPAAAANLTVTPPARVVKSFAPATIATGGISTLTIRLDNFTTSPISPVDFTDPLPADVTVAATPNVTNSCGGTVTAAAGSDTVELGGGTIAAAPSGGTSSCTVTVDVTASTTGVKTNTIASGNWNGVPYLGGSANLMVVTAFTATKFISFRTYGPHRLTFAGSVQDTTITLTNNTTSPITVTSLTDDLTTMGTGFTAAASPSPSTTCAGGVVSAPAGGTTITMTGGTIPASGSCTITLGIHFELAGATAGGGRTNTIAAGNIVTDAGSNGTPVSFGVLVFSPLTVDKAFSPATVNSGGTSTLTIRLGYRADGGGVGVDPMTNISGTDALPTGLVIATPSTFSTTCPGATITAPEGGSTIAFSGASLDPGENCTITVQVEVPPGTPPGPLSNVIPENSLTTDQGVSNSVRTIGGGRFGSPAATANLNVSNSNVTINKTFNPANVPVGTASQLAIAFVNTNPGAIQLTEAAFTDALPAGMVVATPPSATFASTGCAGTISATAGASSVGVSNATINANTTCTLRVNVIANAAGNLTNTIPAGALTSSQSVTNDSSAAATLSVSGNANLGITKTNGTSSLAAGSTTMYTIVVSNAGPHNVIGAVVTDTPPSGMTFTSWTCAASAGASCGTASGSGPINDTIDIDVGATVTYTVEALVAINNSGGSITNTATVTQPALVADPNTGNNSAPDTDTVVPGVVLALTKTDESATYTPGGTATYTVTVANTGPVNAAQVNVSDNLPAGVTLTGTVGCTPSAGASCGTVNGAPGQTSFSAINASIPSGGSLTFTVPVAFAPDLATDPLVNAVTAMDVPSGANGSASDGNGRAASTDVTIVKSGPAFVVPGGPITYTLTIGNAGPSDADGATFSDLVPATVTGITASCGGASGGAVCPGSVSVVGDTVSGTVPTLPVGGSVVVTIDGTASASNGDPIENTASVAPPPGATDPAGPSSSTAVTNVRPTISISKAVDTTVVIPGDTMTYTITVTNTGPTAAGGTTVTDPVPPGIDSQTWTCVPSGGASCTANGVGAIDDTLMTFPPAGSVVYTVTATVSPTPPSNINNTATATPPDGVCSPTNTPPPCTATASVPPVPQVGITKTADTTTVTPGGTITYTITVANTGVVPADATPVSDPIATGIASQTWTCAPSGGATCTAGGVGAISDTITLFPAGSFVTYTVTATVDAIPPAVISNTATATPGGAAICTPTNTPPPCEAVANITSSPQVSIAKNASASTVTPGGTLQYTITVTNTGPVAADGTTVSDPLPTGIDSQTWTCAPNAGATCSANGSGAIADTIAAFPPGSFVTYTVTATVSANPPASIVNTATATPPPDAICTPGNTPPPCSSSATVTPLPQVSVEKTADTAVAVPSGVVHYTISVANSGSVPADGTPVNDPVPAGIASQDWSCTANGGAVCTANGTGAISDTIEPFPPGSFVTYSVTAMIDADPPAQVTNTATASPPDGVCLPDNTPAPCTSSVTLNATAQIGIEKTADVGSVGAGGTLHYTLTVTNTGSGPADGTAVSDPLPAGIASQTWTCTPSGGATCAAGGSGAINDTIATFPAGATVTYLVMAIVETSPPPAITNTATADPPAGGVCAPSNAAPPCSASTTTTVITQPGQLSISKTADTTVLQPGGIVVYTITVANSGPVGVGGVTLSDPLPPGIVDFFWTCAGTGGAVCPNADGSGALMESIASLPVGGALVYTVEASVSPQAPSTVINTATATVTTAVTTTCAPFGSAPPCAASAVVGASGVVEIPTMTPVGLAILAILLGGAAAWILRRARTFARGD